MTRRISKVVEIKTIDEIPEAWRSLPSSPKDAYAKSQGKYFDGRLCSTGNHFSLKNQSGGIYKGCCTCSQLKQREKTRRKRIDEGLREEGYGLAEFRKEAGLVHSEFYDYSLIQAFNYKTDKYEISCPVHGTFKQAATKHLAGQGCRECANEKASSSQRLSQDEYIRKCINRHGDKYDLTRIHYKNMHSPIEVGCRVVGHGFFSTEANNFQRGLSGCQLCAAIATGNRCRKSRESFISEVQKMHGLERYGYQAVNYVNTQSKILIYCPREEHGLFEQRASAHLRGQGCPKCGTMTLATTFAMTIEDFLERSRNKHGSKYDYTKVELGKLCGDKSRGHTKVEILCAEHGSFWQSPLVHFRSGCRKCHMEYLWNEVLAIGFHEWVDRCFEQHNGKYDYSNVKPFTKVLDRNVEIVCPVHGSFTQQARLHMTGRGCQKCGDLNRGRDSYGVFLRDKAWASIETDFYFVEFRGQFYKFGISLDFEDRARKDYTDVFHREAMERAEAWVLEQYLLVSTSWAAPGHLPSGIPEWGGSTELRNKDFQVSEMCDEIQSLLEMIRELGWSVFFQKYILVE